MNNNLNNIKSSNFVRYFRNILNIKPMAGYSNPIIFDLKKLYTSNGGSINAGDDGFNGYVSFRLQPLCDFPPDVPQIIDYDYVFEKQNALGTGFDTLFSGQELCFGLHHNSRNLSQLLRLQKHMKPEQHTAYICFEATTHP